VARPVIRNVGRSSYVAAHFHTLTAPGNLSGRFSYGEYPSPLAPGITMAISSACGDFETHLPTPGCLKADIAPGNPLVLWHFSTSAPDTACALQPDTDYYVNLMVAHPESVGADTVAIGVNLVWQQ
jgi:hypothetical protein